MKTREIAKFLSGFAANQLLAHAALAASGTQFVILGINFTPRLNLDAAIAWALMLMLLVYYSWLRPQKR